MNYIIAGISIDGRVIWGGVLRGWVTQSEKGMPYAFSTHYDAGLFADYLNMPARKNIFLEGITDLHIEEVA